MPLLKELFGSLVDQYITNIPYRINYDKHPSFVQGS